jgi:Mg2+-importing ATPase
VAVDSRLRPSGLSGAEAARRLARDGHNRIEVVRGHRTLRLLLSQFTSPIVLILIAATVLAMVLGDLLDGVIILIIVAASGALGFWQEHTAGRAVDALLARVKIKVEVLRDGREISVPADEVVVGDLVVLRAGDIIPADCRVVEAHSIQVDESALTGESFPAEKALDESLFTGTHVVSGAGLAEIVQTGRRTRYAALSGPARQAGRHHRVRARYDEVRPAAGAGHGRARGRDLSW